MGLELVRLNGSGASGGHKGFRAYGSIGFKGLRASGFLGFMVCSIGFGV